jgi:hypothetical protein
MRLRSKDAKKERRGQLQPAEKTTHSKKKRSLKPDPKNFTFACRRALPSYTAVDERRKSLQESSQRWS